MRAAVLFGLLLLAGCRRETGPVQLFDAEPYPEKLSAWRLFKGETAELTPNDGVIPYDLNTPLFSDYATKFRTIWMPAGKSGKYDPVDVFELPEGTILSKTFMYPPRKVETRLLIHAKDGWVALPYVWDEDGRDATLDIVGESLPMTAVNTHGEKFEFTYSVPNVNQCRGCHERFKTMAPIGPKARHLNRTYAYAGGAENVLTRLARAGYLSGLPADLAQVPRNAVWDDPATGTVEQRARAYLDANCSHCHSPMGPAWSAGIDFRAINQEPRMLGLCKPPVAAGRGSGQHLKYGFVPGKPEESILTYRLQSTDPGVMMPELGRAVVHSEGVELIAQWIKEQPGSCE